MKGNAPGLVVALLAAALLTPAAADAGDGCPLALVASPDSIRTLVRQDFSFHVRLENRGVGPVWVQPPSPGGAGPGVRVDTELLGIRSIPWSTELAPRVQDREEQAILDLVPRAAVRLEPGEGVDVGEAFRRPLGEPGVYRLDFAYWYVPPPESIGVGVQACTLRSNVVVVRADPITGEDMRRLAADPDPTLRQRACFMVAGWGSTADQAAFLRRVLSDSSWQVRCSALGSLAFRRAWHLQRADSIAVVERARELQSGSDPHVRDCAAAFLRARRLDLPRNSGR